VSSSTGDIIDIGPRLRRRCAECEHLLAKETAAQLAADSDDGEFWAIRYLLALIHEQARTAVHR
jgi:hypothetical protein